MENHILGGIMRIARSCTAYRRIQLKDLDLNPGQHWVVSYVCRHPGTAQDQLALHFCMDKTTVAHRLAALEKSGYLERRASPEDGRCRFVYPTEKAMEIFPRVHGAYEVFTQRVVEGLSPQDQKELARLTALLDENAARLLQECRQKGRDEQ